MFTPNQQILKELHEKQGLSLVDIARAHQCSDISELFAIEPQNVNELILRENDKLGQEIFSLSPIVELALMLRWIEDSRLEALLVARQVPLLNSRKNMPVSHLMVLEFEIQVLINVPMIYISGFNFIKSKPSHIEAGCFTDTYEWVKKTNGRTSSFMLAPMYAVSLVAGLERFLRIVAVDISKNPGPEIKKKWRNFKRCGQPDKSISEFLEQYITPTAKSGGTEWMERIEEIFGPVDKDVMSVLHCLVRYRNVYVHSNKPKAEALPMVKGEHLVMWFLVVPSFCMWVSLQSKRYQANAEGSPDKAAPPPSEG